MNNLLHLVIVKYGVISLVLCISTRLRLVTILSLLVKYLVILPCSLARVGNYHNTTNILNVQFDKLEDEREGSTAKQLGYGALKDLQLEVIKGIATGRDVFSVLPTGYGKSPCYVCMP